MKVDLVVKFAYLVVKNEHLVVILTDLVVKITSLVVIVKLWFTNEICKTKKSPQIYCLWGKNRLFL